MSLKGSPLPQKCFHFCPILIFHFFVQLVLPVSFLFLFNVVGIYFQPLNFEFVWTAVAPCHLDVEISFSFYPLSLHVHFPWKLRYLFKSNSHLTVSV